MRNMCVKLLGRYRSQTGFGIIGSLNSVQQSVSYAFVALYTSIPVRHRFFGSYESKSS